VSLNILDRYRKSIEDCFKDVKMIILVCSGKGGVGKTFISTGLAWYISEEYNDKTVGLLDLDLHGFSTHRFLNIEVPVKDFEEEKGPLKIRENLHYFSPAILIGDNPLPIRGHYREKAVLDILSSVKWNVDIVIIDMPPGTGEEVIIPCRYLKSKSYAITVTLMEPVSIKVTERLVDILKDLEIRIIGVVYNMTNYRGLNLFKVSTNTLLNMYKICEIPYIDCVLDSISRSRSPYTECVEIKTYLKPIVDRVIVEFEKLSKG